MSLEPLCYLCTCTGACLFAMSLLQPRPNAFHASHVEDGSNNEDSSANMEGGGDEGGGGAGGAALSFWVTAAMLGERPRG